MANNDYTKATSVQMEVALSTIASMAFSLQDLCFDIVNGDEDGHKSVAASRIAGQIGWIADRCEGFSMRGPDAWLLPPIWELSREEAQPA